MNALPSHRPVPAPQRRTRRPRPQVVSELRPGIARREKIRQNPVQQPIVGAEVMAKLGVNALMVVVAISALARLIPYNMAQTKQLDNLRAEVQMTQSRVDALQTNLEQNFDPQRSRRVMQEQSQLLDPNQKRIIWLQPMSLDSQL